MCKMQEVAGVGPPHQLMRLLESLIANVLRAFFFIKLEYIYPLMGLMVTYVLKINYSQLLPLF